MLQVSAAMVVCTSEITVPELLQLNRTARRWPREIEYRDHNLAEGNGLGVLYRARRLQAAQFAPAPSVESRDRIHRQ